MMKLGISETCGGIIKRGKQQREEKIAPFEFDDGKNKGRHGTGQDLTNDRQNGKFETVEREIEKGLIGQVFEEVEIILQGDADWE